ncbi:MAG TPA: hypothetical protein VGM90_16505 [Kofleriaceae bacterium]|jgi:hypothetical protein
MTRLAFVLLLAASACGKSSAPAASPPPLATTAPTRGFTLGEATVVELLDKRLQPVSNPIWKLHADGNTEGVTKKGEWKSSMVLAKPDGTLWMQGEKVATVTDTAITYAFEGTPPIVIDGDSLSVVVWQKAHDGEDFTAKVELASDGTITVHHRDGVRAYWKIEAVDPLVMRTAFHVFALSMKTILD